VIEAVLFDLDGTLLDSAPDLVGTLNHLRAGVGLASLPVEAVRHCVSQGATGLLKAGMPAGNDVTFSKWKDAFLEHYAANSFVHSKPFDGVDRLLSGLEDLGIPWGIVTNKLEYLSLPIVESAGWLGIVAAVICGDSVDHCKPHPEPVLAACKIMGVAPGNVLMVGDDPRDVEAGRRAGSLPVLALYGYSAEQDHPYIGADTLMIETPQEVLAIVKNSRMD